MIKHCIYPPLNWFDFEQLCVKLWGQLWQIPNEIDLTQVWSSDVAGVMRNLLSDNLVKVGVKDGRRNVYVRVE